MNVTLLFPPPLHTEEVPFPPPFFPVPPPPKTDEILTNLVNLVQHQNNRLEHVVDNQINILMKVYTKSEGSYGNKRCEMSMEVDGNALVPTNRRKGSGRPPDDLDRENSS